MVVGTSKKPDIDLSVGLDTSLSKSELKKLERTLQGFKGKVQNIFKGGFLSQDAFAARANNPFTQMQADMDNMAKSAGSNAQKIRKGMVRIGLPKDALTGFRDASKYIDEIKRNGMPDAKSLLPDSLFKNMDKFKDASKYIKEVQGMKTPDSTELSRLPKSPQWGGGSKDASALIAEQASKINTIFGGVADRFKDASDASKQFNSAAKRTAGELKKMASPVKRVKKEFAGWAMSIMFFGMALRRTFDTIWKSSSKTFNEVMHSTEGTVTGFDRLTNSLSYLGFAAGAALEPVAEWLAPWIWKIAELIQDHESLFATIVTAMGIGGVVFTAIGSGTLAWNGFQEAARLSKVSVGDFIDEIKVLSTTVDSDLKPTSKLFSEKFSDMGKSVQKVMDKFAGTKAGKGLNSLLQTSKGYVDDFIEVLKKFDGAIFNGKIQKVINKIDDYIAALKKVFSWQKKTGLGVAQSLDKAKDAASGAAKGVQRATVNLPGAKAAAGSVDDLAKAAALGADDLTKAGSIWKNFGKFFGEEAAGLGSGFGKMTKFIAKYSGLIEIGAQVIDGLFDDTEGLTVGRSIKEVLFESAIGGLIKGIAVAIGAAFVGAVSWPVILTAIAASALFSGIAAIIGEVIKWNRKGNGEDADVLIDPMWSNPQGGGNSSTYNFYDSTFEALPGESFEEMLNRLNAEINN